jgi:hypothetical protein
MPKTKKSVALPATASDRLLLKLAEAKRIVRRRVSHMETLLVRVDERHAERDIPQALFAGLVTKGYLRAVPQDALMDVVFFEFTDRGERQLQELYERDGGSRA